MLTTMLDYIRLALYATLFIILFFLFQEWGKEHSKKTPTLTTNQTSYIPEIAADTKSASQSTITETLAQGTTSSSSSNVNLIHIKTDVLDITIDPIGGNIIESKLLKYPETLHSTAPISLLNDSSDKRYLAQSGLLGTHGPDMSQGQALYESSQTKYELSKEQNELIVPLVWKNNEGLKVTKIFTLKRNSYEINIDYQVVNQSKEPWEGNLYLQLMRKNTPPESQGFMNLATYFGAAISSPEKRFQKIPFKDMNNEILNKTIQDGWAAMIQHYFISAWVPEKDYSAHYFSKVTNDGLYTIGLIAPKLSVLPGQTATTRAKLYTGPLIASKLEKVAPGLQLTIDYGWFWFISAIIFWMMQKIYDIVGNWGWSIVLVTVIIKLLFYHLSAKSYRSMSAMKKLQPKLNALKERFGEDKQKFTQATLELYKKEKVNPMSGCLPILVQIPVFIGLYWVLIESVQLRQAPFILWIHDLSSKDPFYILPVLMGISMFLQQRLNPPPPDPTQAKVMMFMPIVFTLLFLNFPAGLMLYWLVNNILSFLQQWYIMRSLDNTPKVKK